MPPQNWDEFPRAERPSAVLRAGSAGTHEPGDYSYIELPENGRGALVAWCAGPAHVIQCPLLPTRPVVTTVTNAFGTTRREDPRSTSDQNQIDDLINEYLQEAAVPPCPGGYSWLLRLPEHLSAADFWAEVGAAEKQLPLDAGPAQLRSRFEPLMRELYQN